MSDYEQRKVLESELGEYLADPTKVRLPFKLDYPQVDIVHTALKRVHSLMWFAEVKCSGGWKIIGAFSDEASAWEFGTRHIDVRMWKGDECIGVKDGYKKPWQKPEGEIKMGA